MDNNLFGSWLTEQQRRRHLSDTKLAAAVGVTAPTISRWKGGTVRPREQTILDRLADFFGEDRAKVYILAGHGQVGMDMEGLSPEMAQLAYQIQAHLDAIADLKTRELVKEELIARINSWADTIERLTEFIETFSSPTKES